MFFFKGDVCLSIGIFLLLVSVMKVRGCLKTRRRSRFRKNIVLRCEP